MKAGDTFHNTPASSEPSHLYVILSDPTADPDRVVVVSLTTWKAYKDPACIIQAGAHPFVRHETCAYYAKAREVTAATLEKAANAGNIIWSSPVGPELLRRLRRGALTSSFTPRKIKDLLRSQGTA